VFVVSSHQLKCFSLIYFSLLFLSLTGDNILCQTTSWTREKYASVDTYFSFIYIYTKIALLLTQLKHNMANSLPSSSLLKISDDNKNKNVDLELPVLSSNKTEPTPTHGKIDRRRFFICSFTIFIIIHSMGTFLRSKRSISCKVVAGICCWWTTYYQGSRLWLGHSSTLTVCLYRYMARSTKWEVWLSRIRS